MGLRDDERETGPRPSGSEAGGPRPVRPSGRRLVGPLGLGGVALVGLGLGRLLLGGPGEGAPGGARGLVVAASRVAAVAPALSPDEASSLGRGTLGPEGARAASHLAVALATSARALAERERLEEERRDLARELLRAQGKGDHELGNLRVELEQLGRVRPDLIPGVALAFLSVPDRGAATDRGLLFVLSRALVGTPEGEAALLEGAGRAHPEARREIALFALAGSPDARVLPFARGCFDDGAEPPAVRGAAAFALARRLDALEPPALAAVLGRARDLAASPRAEAEATATSLRGEALHLLARGHEPDRDATGAARGPALAASAAASDRALARTTLAEREAPDGVVLAAAHLALASGEDRASVARALAGHASPILSRAALCLASETPDAASDRAPTPPNTREGAAREDR